MFLSKDPLFRGEFEVVKELVSTLKDGDAAKNECDKIIDKCGTKKTGGTGIKQLRENIAESKLSYEIMDDSAQVIFCIFLGGGGEIAIILFKNSFNIMFRRSLRVKLWTTFTNIFILLFMRHT